LLCGHLKSLAAPEVESPHRQHVQAIQVLVSRVAVHDSQISGMAWSNASSVSQCNDKKKTKKLRASEGELSSGQADKCAVGCIHSPQEIYMESNSDRTLEVSAGYFSRCLLVVEPKRVA